MHSVCSCILHTVFDSVSFDILTLLVSFKETKCMSIDDGYTVVP